MYIEYFVPRRTLNTLRICIVAILSMHILLGCNKPEPNPELRDPIYQDLVAQLAATQKSIGDADKAYKDKLAELSKAKPQTGQFKYIQGQAFQAEHAFELLKQQEKYWKIRISERKRLSRMQYLKAFKKKEPWPSPEEFKEYETEKRLRQAKLSWDNKKRIEAYKKEMSSTGAPKAAEH